MVHFIRLLTVVTTVLVMAGMLRLVWDRVLPSRHELRGLVMGWMITIGGVSISIIQHYGHNITLGVMSVLIGNLVTLVSLMSLIHWNHRPRKIEHEDTRA